MRIPLPESRQWYSCPCPTPELPDVGFPKCGRSPDQLKITAGGQDWILSAKLWQTCWHLYNIYNQYLKQMWINMYSYIYIYCSACKAMKWTTKTQTANVFQVWTEKLKLQATHRISEGPDRGIETHCNIAWTSRKINDTYFNTFSFRCYTHILQSGLVYSNLFFCNIFSHIEPVQQELLRQQMFTDYSTCWFPFCI